MLALLSPSKTLDMTPASAPLPASQPDFLNDSEALVAQLREVPVEGLRKLMGISESLATLNHERYRQFSQPFTLENAKPAILAFKGDVYEPLTIGTWSTEDFAYANAHLRILSGLYGLLRPLDLMQPYRLEMGIGLKNTRGKDLYAFWGRSITEAINAALAGQKQPILLNLASQEYFKAVQPSYLQGTLINVCFLDQKGTAEPKVVGLYAKQARGLMADFLVRQRVETIEALKAFNDNNYRFNPALSDDTTVTFLRRH
jgi:cytoplasmic iron level regulating protein YaaA (DUF328/UPF0246 family)